MRAEDRKLIQTDTRLLLYKQTLQVFCGVAYTSDTAIIGPKSPQGTSYIKASYIKNLLFGLLFGH